jgi:holliday junction DNA helicase RuvA
MIGRLSGVVVLFKPPMLILDVGGIGYEVCLPISDCASIGNGEQVILHTHLVIREDAHSLYGFVTLESRDTFRTLLKVSGIGPRIALALLSTLTPTELHHALDNSDVTKLSQTPGIGKKMAERMILELKGKLYIENNTLSDDGRIPGGASIIYTDIANALTSLGYADKEIKNVIKNLPLGITDLSSGIKEALRLFNK